MVHNDTPLSRRNGAMVADAFITARVNNGEKSIKRCIYMYSMLDVCGESRDWNVDIDQSHHHLHTSAAITSPVQRSCSTYMLGSNKTPQCKTLCMACMLCHSLTPSASSKYRT